MNYLSVCSGIEAATVAWHDLGFNPIGFSEIEKFPCDLLAHHYPDVPNYGDMTKYKEWQINGTVDLVVGGTPCQSFSVAGLRKGLDDPRGNLMLTYLGILDRFKPKWCVWENVPGVLSSNGGRDFGSFLGALAKLGYGFAYRVLDAQYFGIPQRRRRVFVVGYFGDATRAAQVLFERGCLLGDSKTSKRKRQESTSYTATSFGGYVEGVGTLKASGGDLGGGSENLVIWPAQTTCTLDASYGRLYGQDNQHIASGASLFVPVMAFQSNHSKSMDMPVSVEQAPTLTTNAKYVAVCIAGNHIGRGIDAKCCGSGFKENVSFTLSASKNHAVMYKRRVRRLMPIECERLQGFPDNYTLIPGARAKKIDEDEYTYLLHYYPDLTLTEAKRLSKDSPRYKALGNSMAVPVMRWIGKRIQAADKAVF